MKQVDSCENNILQDQWLGPKKTLISVLVLQPLNSCILVNLTWSNSIGEDLVERSNMALVKIFLTCPSNAPKCSLLAMLVFIIDTNCSLLWRANEQPWIERSAFFTGLNEGCWYCLHNILWVYWGANFFSFTPWQVPNSVNQYETQNVSCGC